MEKLLTIKQIAQATGLSSVTLYKAIESKDPATRLAHHKFGKAVKVSESDLEKWIASKRVREDDLERFLKDGNATEG